MASCTNLWALIMDAGTGFMAQVYELSPYFLHKVRMLSSNCIAYKTVLLMDTCQYLEVYYTFIGR